MAQTTTQINACDAVIKLQNTEGTMVDISGSSNRASMNQTQALGMLTTFGADDPVRAACGRDATINFSFIYTQAQNEACAIWKDWWYNYRKTKRRLTIDLPDSDDGGDRYQFDLLIESCDIPIQAGDPNPVLVAVTCRPTGAFTWTILGS